MKVILNNSIRLEDIDEDKHIVVAVIDNKPTILGKGFIQNRKELSFFILGVTYDEDATITIGNGFRWGEENDTIQKMIAKAINVRGAKVEVFNKTDWRSAMNWLMDNTDIVD